MDEKKNEIILFENQGIKDVVKQSVVTGLATRLQIFQTKKVRQITDKSDIDLRAPRQRKVCLFLCYK